MPLTPVIEFKQSLIAGQFSNLRLLGGGCCVGISYAWLKHALLTSPDELLSSYQERKHYVISQSTLIHQAQANHSDTTNTHYVFRKKFHGSTQCDFFYSLYFPAKLFSLKVQRSPLMDYNKRGTCEFISYQHSENNDSLERTINLYVFEHSHAVFLQFIFKDESSGKLPSHTTVFIKHVSQKSDEQDTYIFFDPNAGEFHLKEDELPSFFYNHFLRYKMHNDLLFQLYPVSLQTSASTPKT